MSASRARILDTYSVGKKIGKGAFGIVSDCIERSTGKEFAVKFVDEAKSPVQEIEKEVRLMQHMNHPNVVKCHNVFYERGFVCIVMDKIRGGDLVDGLQWHLKNIGQIPPERSQHVVHQMAASIQYMHHRQVMHRDVKGDNYLMSVKNMTDPDCRIVLVDFGTCCTFKEGERHSAHVGTRSFWSPEFFDKSYGPKVDVWAMGVTMYGLVNGRFPFKNENEVKNKVFRISSRINPVCVDFMDKCFQPEQNRPSSNEVMAHAWVRYRA